MEIKQRTRNRLQAPSGITREQECCAFGPASVCQAQGAFFPVVVSKTRGSGLSQNRGFDRLESQPLGWGALPGGPTILSLVSNVENALARSHCRPFAKSGNSALKMRPGARYSFLWHC